MSVFIPFLSYNAALIPEWKNCFSCLFSSTIIVHFADGRHHRRKGVHSRVQQIWLSFRKWTTQTLWWVQNWNLRHIYQIVFYLFFEPFFARLALMFSKSTNIKKLSLTNKNRYKKTQNFTPISTSENSAYFHYVFANNFFVHFFALSSTFCIFDCNCARNGSKKRRIFFMNVS